MIVRRIQCCILTFLLCAIFWGCSINNDPHASGTGVGNPGGAVTVSIVADTGVVPEKIRNLYVSSSGVNDIFERTLLPGDPIPIMGEDSLILTVTSAFIVVQRIYFVLADNENGYTLIDSNNSGPIYTDSEHIILDGPFIFDALTGSSTPSIDSIQLPEAKYTGIKLHITNDSTSEELEGYAIVLEGTFEYKDTLRNFSIKLIHDIKKNYNYKGPPFSISQGDSVQFLIVLNADQWLNYISLKEYLDEDFILLDQNGDLIIDKTTDTNPYKDFKKAVRLNIIKSGILFITST